MQKYQLALGLLGNFARYLSSADFFKKIIFFKNFFHEYLYHRVLNSLDPDQTRPFVGPTMDSNCLQRLSPDDISRQRGKCLNECY